MITFLKFINISHKSIFKLSWRNLKFPLKIVASKKKIMSSRAKFMVVTKKYSGLFKVRHEKVRFLPHL